MRLIGLMGIYLLTMPRSIGLGDSGLLAAAATTLGIPHPPGFPTYVLLGHLFTKIPWGTVAWRLELLSVAAALGIVVLVARRAGWLAALMLAFSYGFWSQAVNVETYMLTNLVVFLVAALATPSRCELLPPGRWLLWLLLGLLLGLGLGLNPIVIAVLPSLVFRIRRIGLMSLMGLIALLVAGLVYSYLPLRARAGPFLNWSNPRDWTGVVQHITGGGLSVVSSTVVNGFTGSWYWFADAWWRFGYLAVVEFVGVGAVLAILGAVVMYRKDRREFWFWIILILTNVSLAGLYTSGNRDSWYITSFIVMAVFIGEAIKKFEIRSTKFEIMMMILPVLLLVVWGPRMWQRAKSDLVMHYVNDLYTDLPKDAVLMGGGETFNALTVYAHEVLGWREVTPVDMTIFYGQKWYRDNLMEGNAPSDPPLKLRGGRGSYKEVKVDMPKFTDELEFSRILEQLAEAMGDRPVFVTGYLLTQPIYGGTLTPAYVPQEYQLVPEGIVYRLTLSLMSPIRLMRPIETQEPWYLESNYRKAVGLIKMEYGLAYEMRGDYFGANRVAPEYFDQNWLRERMNQPASPSAVPSDK